MAVTLGPTGVTFSDSTTQTAAIPLGGAVNRTVFLSPGVWTKPSNLKAVTVTVIGGGGGGQSALRLSYNTPEGPVIDPGYGQGGAAGGGIGGFVAGGIFFPAPILSNTINVAVGSGGAGGTGPSPTGVSGGTSSFGDILSCTGGEGGYGDGILFSFFNALPGGTVYNVPPGAPALTYTALNNFIDAQSSARSTYGTVPSVNGGSLIGGVYLRGANNSINIAAGSNGSPAVMRGAGGSGAVANTSSATARPGGNGNSGIVIVTEYY